jgi:MoaD family protein
MRGELLPSRKCSHCSGIKRKVLLAPKQKAKINSFELITVKVRTILDLKKIIGSREVEFSVPKQSTLAKLLATMAERWGEELSSRLFEPNSLSPLPHIRLMVNGQDIAFLNRLETELQEGDEILILPPVSGG